MKAAPFRAAGQLLSLCQRGARSADLRGYMIVLGPNGEEHNYGERPLKHTGVPYQDPNGVW